METLGSTDDQLISSFPQPLATAIPLPDSLNLTTLDTSYKWNHVGFVLLWLTYFPQDNIIKVHSCYHILQNILLFLRLIFCFMYVSHSLYPFNQNHKKVSPHTYYTGYYQRDKFWPGCGEIGALVKLWTESGVATLINSTGVPQKIKKRIEVRIYFEEILVHSSTLQSS